MWSRDGTEIFYRVDQAVVAMDVLTEPTFQPGTPRVLFDGPYQADLDGHPNYDVSSDGRFLMIQLGDGVSQIHIVQNWFVELGRLSTN